MMVKLHRLFHWWPLWRCQECGAHRGTLWLYGAHLCCECAYQIARDICLDRDIDMEAIVHALPRFLEEGDIT